MTVSVRRLGIFFVSGEVKSGLNYNFMVLISKEQGADVIEKSSPIVLGNFLFKVITKILAERLAVVARKIMDPHQFGFIQGKNIENCIAVASEYVNGPSARSAGGNMALKLEIRKAFDTMD